MFEGMSLSLTRMSFKVYFFRRINGTFKSYKEVLCFRMLTRLLKSHFKSFKWGLKVVRFGIDKNCDCFMSRIMVSGLGFDECVLFGGNTCES